MQILEFLCDLVYRVDNCDLVKVGRAFLRQNSKKKEVGGGVGHFFGPEST